ncbi:MAG: hypothetical protein EBU26_17635, partial [Verrucomicrobia bacterium]|nr:hypothetical protein [Verrucomicrobiota bacterium]
FIASLKKFFTQSGCCSGSFSLALLGATGRIEIGPSMMVCPGLLRARTAVRSSLNQCEQASGTKLLAKKLKPFGRAQLQAMTRN